MEGRVTRLPMVIPDVEISAVRFCVAAQYSAGKMSEEVSKSCLLGIRR